MNDIKVCFYVYGFPPEYSGATVHIIKLCKALRAKGVQSTFLTYTYNKQYLKLTDCEGFEVVRFLRDPNYKLTKYNLKLLWNLFRNRNKYDIIYINGNEGQFWTPSCCIVFGKIFSKKVIMRLNMEHYNSDILAITGTRFSKLKLFIARHAYRYVSLSTAISNGFRKINVDDTLLSQISNGVDTNIYKGTNDKNEKIKLKNKLGLPQNKKLIMSCGAIRKRKGIDFLLDIYKRVVKSYPDTVLVLIGPYDYVEVYDDGFVKKMFNIAEAPPLSGKVIFTGLVDNVNEYLKVADLFVFPSRQEGSPNVLKEAMASGLPIVTLNLPNITSDMINNYQDGIIVNVKDKEEFRDWQNRDISDDECKEKCANWILKLLNNEDLAAKLGTAARRKVEQEFSMEKEVAEYLELFKSCYS